MALLQADDTTFDDEPLDAPTLRPHDHPSVDALAGEAADRFEAVVVSLRRNVTPSALEEQP
jgi:hypothetical protein